MDPQQPMRGNQIFMYHFFVFRIFLREMLTKYCNEAIRDIASYHIALTLQKLASPLAIIPSWLCGTHHNYVVSYHNLYHVRGNSKCYQCLQVDQILGRHSVKFIYHVKLRHNIEVEILTDVIICCE